MSGLVLLSFSFHQDTLKVVPEVLLKACFAGLLRRSLKLAVRMESLRNGS